MVINESDLRSIRNQAICERVMSYGTYENLFKIKLKELAQEIVGDELDTRTIASILDVFTIYHYDLFKDSELAQSYIRTMELNNLKTFGSYSSHNILKAMNAHWSVLSEEDKLDFMKPCKGGTVGYLLAGGLYWCNVLGGFTTEDEIIDKCPQLYKTSYVGFNSLMGNYNVRQLSDGVQFDKINDYMRFINYVKNSKTDESSLIK